jgi:hypothetical protein
MEAVEKGKLTARRRRRQRASKSSAVRRQAQTAEVAARRFPREISATAIVLSALEPGRSYLRSEIHAACPELPSGAVGLIYA